MTQTHESKPTARIEAGVSALVLSTENDSRGFAAIWFDGQRSPQPPRVFLLDDDAVFCKLMEKIARRNGIPFAACSSLDRLGFETAHHDYDVAIVDYYLEDMRGPQIAPLLGERPIVLVSRSEACVDEQAQWPQDSRRFIKQFVAKKRGPLAILEAAIALGPKQNPPPTPGSSGRGRHLRAVR